MTCLHILRNIYVKDEDLRKYFLNSQGVAFLQSILKSKKKDYLLINEVLFNIEDLIYGPLIINYRKMMIF